MRVVPPLSTTSVLVTLSTTLSTFLGHPAPSAPPPSSADRPDVPVAQSLQVEDLSPLHRLDSDSTVRLQIPQPAPQSTQSAPAPAPEPAGEIAQAASYPDTLDGWIAEATDILIAAGYDPAQIDPAAIRLIALRESGGNPKAINLWDSNAAKGIPSKGLMQTIDPTFNAYKLPGYDNIWNPVHNIIAAVRYAITRYGSLANVPGVKSVRSGGKYRGY